MMDSKLKKLQAELRDLQGKLDLAASQSEARVMNERCGALRRAIRSEQRKIRAIREAIAPRFTERGRS